MKILNKSENIILDVTDEDRIKKLLGYPDKFKVIEDEQPSYFQDNKKGKKNGNKNKIAEEENTEKQQEEISNELPTQENIEENNIEM